MKVKIGQVWYSSDDTPICVQLSSVEQKQISTMDVEQDDQRKYAVFPNNEQSKEEMLKWMAD